MRELKKRILANVLKDGRHWVWVGGVDSRGLPRMRREPGRGRALSARQLTWEAFVGTPVSRLRLTCDEPQCVAPECMREWVGCSRGHTGKLTKDGGCVQCRRMAQRKRWTCGSCGQGMWTQSRKRHLQNCKGPEAPSAPESRPWHVQDAVNDWQRGITLERILETYSTTPGALAKRLERAGHGGSLQRAAAAMEKRL